MFWDKISNEGQVFVFMNMQILTCSSWLSTAALRMELFFLPPVPTSVIISHRNLCKAGVRDEQNGDEKGGKDKGVC